MTYYEKRSLDSAAHGSDEKNEPRPNSICVFTVETVNKLLCAIDPRSGCEGFPHAGAALKYRFNHSASEVQDVVNQYYSKDKKLWNDLVANGGVMCY